MKVLVYNLIFLASGIAFAGGESGGTIISQEKIQTAIDFNFQLPQALLIRGENSVERIISNRLSVLDFGSATDLASYPVFKLNYLGSTDASTIVSINEDAFVVELPNSTVLRSEILRRAIEASATNNQWFSLDN